MITYSEIDIIRHTSKAYVALVAAQGYTEPLILKKVSQGNAELYQQLLHMENDHLPRIYEISQQEDVVLVLEEYLEGSSLDRYVKENNLSAKEIVALMLQLCDGLEALHEAEPPIIHRDLKPSNVLVSKEGHLTIIDFDASRNYKLGNHQDTVIMGTKEYASQEQYGFSQTDRRSDIYSVGAMMYELFFYKTLVSEKTEKSIAENLLDDRFLMQHRNGVGQGILRIISRCTMFDPEKRYSDIRQLEHDLRHYQSYSFRRSLKKWMPAVGIIAVMFAALMCVAYFSGRKNKAFQESAGISVPAATPVYTGKITETFMDYYDPDTGAHETMMYYYLKSDPKRTRIEIKSGAARGLNVAGITVQQEGSYQNIMLSPEDWYVDDREYVILQDHFLQSLGSDAVYRVSINYTSVIVNFDLKVIDYVEDAVTQTSPQLMPGCEDYFQNDPQDIVLRVINLLDQKLLKIIDGQTGEEVDPKYYKWKGNEIIFLQELFADKRDGTTLQFLIYYGEDQEHPVTTPLSFLVAVRNHPYVAPEFQKVSYTVHRSQKKDLVIPLTWNDAKDRLEFIMDADGNKIKNKYITTDRYSIIISHKYFDSVMNGSSQYVVEFGDVASTVSITVAK